ncbi:hypothetical protein [uncultured Fibrobacter sp.]|uniref:hypothetical protein n=1 Tax=uncultured Fibrobacter sp. TaxID=261512 RepID=UPI00262986C5|nr:hypothetical protein [uncultured Fibrobacter sp.]
MPSENAIIERAETYLRKLSCGVNPLTDEILPEGDACRQERISKCLAYVASLLQQQLNHDQVATINVQPRKQVAPKAAKPAMQELSLETEALARYRFFDYPVSISRVVRNINELLPKDVNMNHLLYADVANFLVQEGILSRQVTENGTEANLPTALGESYGFEKGESELRGHHNIYTQCWQKAQQYILDNIQKCIAIANERFANRKSREESELSEKNSRRGKAKFHLTAEQLKEYPEDETPIPVSEMARRLNMLVGPEMEHVYYKVIRDWYASENYLEFKMGDDGKSAFLPTEKGSLAGLMVESRTGKLGELYDVVMYDAKAQRLYLDHLAGEMPEQA